MKKIIFISMAALFLAACQSNAPNPTNEEPVNNAENENEHANNANNNEETNETNEETVIEKNDKNNETENETNDNNIESNEENAEVNNENTNNETETEDVEDVLVQLGKDIFQAQFDKDTDFLESILSNGSSLDGETFHFENVTYPHEQPFFTPETAADLEVRYTHENDETSYIVGFAAIDEVNEYSFVIDFEFVKEDGEWRMNDMDVNK